jgi:hypothetical protein
MTVIAAAQRLGTDSIIPAAPVQTTATIKTAPVKANCAVVAQIQSGKANRKARPTAMPPTWAVETLRALKSAQQGPIMSSTIRMIRVPRSASAAAMSIMATTLNPKKKRLVLAVTGVNIAVGPQ